MVVRYDNAMKQLKKILLISLPPAVEQALREQFQPFDFLQIGNAGDFADSFPDLVIADSAATAAMPGCPVLSLSWEQPKKLGALLRQISQMLAQPVLYTADTALGGYVFRPQKKTLSRDGAEDILLTDREADILVYLLRHRPQPVSRDALLKNVWRYQEGVDTHTLETHIYRLRQKIEAAAETPELLLTVDGGYILQLAGEEMGQKDHE